MTNTSTKPAETNTSGGCVNNLSDAMREAIHAWVREDLSTGAQMMIGFHLHKLADRLDAVLALSPSPPMGGEEKTI